MTNVIQVIVDAAAADHENNNDNDGHCDVYDDNTMDHEDYNYQYYIGQESPDMFCHIQHRLIQFISF